MATVKIKDVRIAFTDNLWVAKEFTPGDGRPRRSATFIVEPESANDKMIREEIKKIAATAWGEKAGQMLKKYKDDPAKFCYVFEKANKSGDVFEGFEGMMSISANRADKKGPVLVVDRDGRTPIPGNSGKLYAGCYVNATIDLWAQTGQFAGIRAALSGVQFVREGDAFAGAPPASENDFTDLTDGADAEVGTIDVDSLDF